MRYWWLDHVKEKFSIIFNDVSIDYPSPYFRDITIELNQWNESMNSNNLSEIARICNKMLMPTILCPWGESVFPHKHGSVSIDLIFQRYLQQCEIPMIDSKHISKVKWARDDFLRDEEDIDVWLLNPEWKIQPTIAFINGTPKILTCEDHDGGKDEIVIHTCRWEHTLPASISDQISQAVIQSRTIRRGKLSSYSTEWQMFEQLGTFGSLDTCNHVQFG